MPDLPDLPGPPPRTPLRTLARRVRLALGGLGLGTLALLACRGPAGDGSRSADATDPGASPQVPYLVVLGTAQDGGLPQLGCRGACCEAARADPARRRLVSSVLLVDPASGGRWLLDAGPDLAEQVERARPHLDPRERAPDVPGRPPLFDGVLLTHAHLGHCAGLLELGREAYGAAGQPTWVTPRMAAFLTEHAPWSLLVEAGHLELRTLEPGVRQALAPGLTVEALPVPHRDEFSDTVAWLVRTPAASALYLPDIDKWERWERPLEAVLAEVDVALLDATFFGPDELRGRDLAEVPHPFVVETLARLGPLPARERDKVRLTHLNHSNPLAVPGSEARARVRAAGLHVAEEGEVIPLGPRR